MGHVHRERPLVRGHRGAQRPGRGRLLLGRQVPRQRPGHAQHRDVDGPGVRQRALAPQPDRALDRVVRVRLRQPLLVRAPGLPGQLLQRHHVRSRGDQVAGGAGRVGIAGADVVADHGEVTARVGLVAEHAAEEGQPHRDRQQQRDQGGGRSAPQRSGQQHRDEHAEPRQERLHQAADVLQPVRDPRVQQHEQAEEQRERREHRAALPGLRPGGGADRPPDARAPGTGAAIPGVVIPAAGATLTGLRRVPRVGGHGFLSVLLGVVVITYRLLLVRCGTCLQSRQRGVAGTYAVFDMSAICVGS